MPATNYTELFKFEEQLESGFSNILTGITSNIYFRRGTSEKSTPYIDVLVTTQPATLHEHVASSTGSEDTEENLFGGRLEVQAVTARSKTGQNTAHHNLLGGVRAALRSSNTGAYTSNNFPYVAVLEISSGGTEYEVDQESGRDITTMIFDFHFGIRSDAWPA